MSSLTIACTMFGCVLNKHFDGDADRAETSPASSERRNPAMS